MMAVNKLTAQKKKHANATRITENIEIDGLLNEAAWSTCDIATDFVTHEPAFGLATNFKTEVRLAYDDRAIYIAAILHDQSPDSILRQFTQRDEEHGNTDIFAFDVNPYNDGQNSYAFWVTAANVQVDVKMSINDEDSGWDAVWESEVSFNDSAWIVEVKLPYSVLRIPKVKEQEWGINFWRHVRRIREWSSWNPVTKEIDNIAGQQGILDGIYNIDPPLRLALYPYVSGYVQLNEGLKEPSYSLNGGLDLKYGIDESYTLDMTLIPDFGQTKSDEEVLNLSPFEVQYDENRSFFTEGTELFNRAGLFYSRRIGRQPGDYYKVGELMNDGEQIKENPDAAKLLNATKVSGRNANNLGLGFFNAVSDNTYAIIEDTLSGDTRKILTEPLTNYNILVADQAFRNGSFVNIINTNVYKPETGGIANVTGAVFRLMDRANKFGIKGGGALSYRDGLDSINSDFGEKMSFEIGKLNGKWTYFYIVNALSDRYNPNDMGYLSHNNLIAHDVYLNFKKFEPFWRLIKFNSHLHLGYDQQFSDGAFTKLSLSYNYHMTFKNYLSFGGDIGYVPHGVHDYYEPRIEGRYYRAPGDVAWNTWISSDYRKRVAVDVNAGFYKSSEDEGGYWYAISPRLRVNDRFFIVYNLRIQNVLADGGFISSSGDNYIVFGKRDTKTVTNTLFGSYIFNNKSSLTLNLRHYWSEVDVYDFFLLQQDGNLATFDYGFDPNLNESSHDQNFNVFTIDMVYSWNFAPGSFLNIVWKNYIHHFDKEIDLRFFSNLSNTFDAGPINSFSAKLIYYLDYQRFARK